MPPNNRLRGASGSLKLAVVHFGPDQETAMRKLPLLFALAASAIVSAPVIAADFETGEYYYVDHLSCLELAREEGQLIIKISALHPVVKRNRHGEAATRVKELKIDKRTVHHERRRVECI
jgi:hypothetical protein